MKIRPESPVLLRKKIRLHPAQLSIKMSVSLSPVSELSHAPSLVPKLAPVAELRWFYTSNRGKKADFRPVPPVFLL